MGRHTYEVAVVGAGPIGIELAVALKRAGIDYVHFDARQIGYTISWYAPQTRFFSSNERIAIAGVPLMTPEQGKATREQYLMYLRAIIEQFDLQVRTYEPVIDLHRDADGIFTIVSRTTQGEQLTRARRVVLATGGTDRPRKLNVPGEDLPHVAHYFGDPHQYFHKKLLVIGGKNSAIEAALRCHHAGAKVTLSYRGPQLPEPSIKYWLLPEIRSLTQAHRVRAYFSSRVTKITPTSATIELSDGPTVEVETDFVLVQIGFEQDKTVFQKAGVHLEGGPQCPVYDHATMMTSVPDLYVAGTAVGGTQEKFSVFIENCHEHVTRIMRSMFGVDPEVSCVSVGANQEES